MNVAACLQHYERIGVVGLGLTGVSSARFLCRHGFSPVLFDTRPDGSAHFQQATDLHSCENYLGPLQLEDLLSLDLVIVSPGLPLSMPELMMARDAGVELISDIELFGRLVDVPVVAVTGSNGKSTVVSLTAHILNTLGRKAGLGGNIGTPALDLLDSGFDCIVLELSSFQLELTSSLPLTAATVLNISADHLDRYSDLEAYARVKNRIYRMAEVCIYNRDDSRTLPLRKRHLQHWVSIGMHADDRQFGLFTQGSDEFISFAGMPLLSPSQVPMPGDYSKTNVQAALALVSSLGADLEQAASAVRTFVPLAHRCQMIWQDEQSRWINDSKATNPGATIAAIEGLRADVTGKLILIAGGDGKGADFDELKPILEQVDCLITLGRDGPQIARLKRDAIQVKSLEEAVAKARKHLIADSLVLLSPACASLDMFKDYQQRGECFAAAVEAVYGSA